MIHCLNLPKDGKVSVVCAKCSGEKSGRSASSSSASSSPMLAVQDVEQLLKLVGNPGMNLNNLWLYKYRVRRQLSDLSFVCFLPRYCFVCSILLGQVGIRQNG